MPKHLLRPNEYPTLSGTEPQDSLVISDSSESEEPKKVIISDIAGISASGVILEPITGIPGHTPVTQTVRQAIVDLYTRSTGIVMASITITNCGQVLDSGSLTVTWAITGTLGTDARIDLVVAHPNLPANAIGKTDVANSVLASTGTISNDVTDIPQDGEVFDVCLMLDQQDGQGFVEAATCSFTSAGASVPATGTGITSNTTLLAQASIFEDTYFANIADMSVMFAAHNSISACGSGNGGSATFPRPWQAEVSYQMYQFTNGLADMIRYSAVEKPARKQAYIDLAWEFIDWLAPRLANATGTDGCSDPNVTSFSWSQAGVRYGFLNSSRGLGTIADLCCAIWDCGNENARVLTALNLVKPVYDRYDDGFTGNPSATWGSAYPGTGSGFWTVSPVGHYAGVYGKITNNQGLKDRYANHLQEIKNSIAASGDAGQPATVGKWFSGTSSGYTGYVSNYLDIDHAEYIVRTINYALTQQAMGQPASVVFTNAEIESLADTFCGIFNNPAITTPGGISGRHIAHFGKWLQFNDCIENQHLDPATSFTFSNPAGSGTDFFNFSGDMNSVAMIVAGYSFDKQ